MARRRIAVVGLGMAVAPHVESALALSERVELAWVCAPSAARRQAFAARWPALAAVPQAASIDEVLADRSVEALVLLAPPATHLPLVERCAAAGRHVLLEKPLEVSTERAERLVAVCRDAGTTLGLVLLHRFRPAAIERATRLRAGAIGHIVSASAGIRLWRPQLHDDQPGRGTRERDGGGVLLTQGIHTLDLLLHLAGPVAEVAAFAATAPAPRRSPVPRCNCACTTARVSTSRPTPGPAAPAPTRWRSRRTGTAGRAPAIDGGEALRVHRLIDALLASGAVGGRPRRVTGRSA